MATFNTLPRTLQAFAFETVTVSNVAKALTAATYNDGSSTSPDRARAAMITCETDTMRYRFDGTDPDVNTGHLLYAGDVLWMDSQHALAKVRFIRTSGDATLQVTYLR